MQDRKSNFYSQLGMVERLEEYWGDITCVHTMLESFEYEYMGVKFDQHHRLHMGWCAVLSKLGIEWIFLHRHPVVKVFGCRKFNAQTRAMVFISMFLMITICGMIAFYSGLLMNVSAKK